VPLDEPEEPPLELDVLLAELLALEVLDEVAEEPKLLEPPVAPLDVLDDELPDEAELAELAELPELPLDPWWGGLWGGLWGLPPLDPPELLELALDALDALLLEAELALLEPPLVLVEAVKMRLPLDPPKKPPLKKPPPKPEEPPLPPMMTAGPPPPLNVSAGGRGGIIAG
jgi:hypothetical protein